MATQPGTLLPLINLSAGGVARTSVRGTAFLVVGGVSATVLPVVSVSTPLPPATTTTPIIVTVVGGNINVPIRRAWIDVAFPGILASEVVHNGSRFGAFYSNGMNSRVAYADTLGRVGYRYTLLRDGGWPAGSLPLTASFTINAVDTLGNGT